MRKKFIIVLFTLILILPPALTLAVGIAKSVQSRQTENAQTAPVETSPIDTDTDIDNMEIVVNAQNYPYNVVSLVALNVRTAPDTDSEVVGILDKNDEAFFIDNENGWYKIYYDGGFYYVSARYDYSIVVKSYEQTAFDRIVDEGLKVLATPYEYGSTRLLTYSGALNPNFTGETFDCSAFIQYIYYKGAGVFLQGDSRSQSLQGTTVSFDRLQAGDLLFMYSSARKNNTGLERIGHVAMYLGDNKILHTFGTGGVRIQEFTSFWQERVIKINRVL